MNRRVAVYLFLFSSFTVLWGGVSSCIGYRQDSADLVEVRSQLVDSSWLWGHHELDRLASTWGAGREAKAGLAILDALVGNDDLDPRVPAAESLTAFPVGLLLQRALEEQRYQGCLRLVALLKAAGAPGFDEFAAAALLELGRFAEARQIQLPEENRTQLASRLGSVLGGDLETTLVRDRRGNLLGKVAAEEGASFMPEAGIAESLVPKVVVAGLDELGPARSVRLTIDLELSQMALRALGSYHGSIVVVDPKDGSVLAAVSDGRSYSREGSPALEQLREPASIAKIITVSAALRAGIDVDQVLQELICRGSEPFDDGLLYCSAINGRLRGLNRAMAVSCNVAFAHLGKLVGREALLDEYARYGFDLEGADGAYLGRVLQPEPKGRELGELAVGLEATAITPVHAALQAGMVANGGYMLPPHLFRSTDSFLGFSERLLPASSGWRVLEDAWLPILVGAMEAVVQPGGTAARVAPSSFPVALKTGTASDPRTGFHVNYIGFGPQPEPRYAFAVRVTHQRTSRRVRNAAFAVTRRFLRGLAEFERNNPDPDPEPPRDSHLATSLAG